ncbi:putative transcriptional regulator [Anaerobacterium chartisolvens]|uniref:Putative transcriptional regulator n=1 Tax=Anaerobacterium chartisolvens TaxID=1297424 RepID=A0A369BN54_9FIRM|nr:helix-turn-helix domain-containing protein [Anaerobacterium chartisolvens]RCX21104.1 putative transcriptional regulator [Anaerobacterium chartisolvens]
MSEFNLFESIKNGLEEAIEYEKGNSINVRVKRVKIEPIRQHTSQEIKDIRAKANLSQSAFANFMGVSKKTVEAWEAGINIPQGSSQRLLEIISKDSTILQQYIEQ